MSLKEMIAHLRIEEDNRKIKRKSIAQLGANFVKFGSRINKKRKVSGDAPKRDNFKNVKKFKGKY